MRLDLWSFVPLISGDGQRPAGWAAQLYTQTGMSEVRSRPHSWNCSSISKWGLLVQEEENESLEAARSAARLAAEREKKARKKERQREKKAAEQAKKEAEDNERRQQEAVRRAEVCA